MQNQYSYTEVTNEDQSITVTINRNNEFLCSHTCTPYETYNEFVLRIRKDVHKITEGVITLLIPFEAYEREIKVELYEIMKNGEAVAQLMARKYHSIMERWTKPFITPAQVAIKLYNNQI